MKSYMILALCLAASIAMTGCRYNKSKAGAGDDGVTNVGASDIDTVTGVDENGNQVPATAVPFDQLYKRVTDYDPSPVYFGFDASTIPSGELTKVEDVAGHLREHADRVVIVEGNCDERGSNEYNMSLGELRAVAIRDYLVNLGIAADRIQTRSYGEEKPAVVGNDEAAYAKNRRGEFAVFQK